jgi:hypothetical protein
MVKANGEQCKGYSTLDSDACSFHSYDHKTKKLPKANEREAARLRRAKRRSQPQRRAVCNCPAYRFPHRLSSGFCRYPDPPMFRSKTFGAKRRASEQSEVYRSGETERTIARAYEHTTARGKVESSTDEYESSRESSLVADDNERQSERRQELDPQLERQVSAYIDLMKRTWSTT